MQNETITVTNTESGKTMDVLVYDKRPGQITVVIGEGVHSIKCELTPTKNEQAYVGVSWDERLFIIAVANRFRLNWMK